MRVARRILIVVVVLAAVYPATILGFYYFTPTHNGEFTNADVIIVLGCAANRDGSPTPEMRERVMEGVHEYEKGVSRHMILTGGAVRTPLAEAHAMSLLAEANGIPPSAITEEPQARDTIQNIYYSEQIMKANGWHTAEVISSPYHLPRTALILKHHPDLQWRTRPSHWAPTYTLWRKTKVIWGEAGYCFDLRIHGFRPSRFISVWLAS